MDPRSELMTASGRKKERAKNADSGEKKGPKILPSPHFCKMSEQRKSCEGFHQVDEMGGVGSNPSELERFGANPSKGCECRAPTLNPHLRWDTLDPTPPSWDVGSSQSALSGAAFSETIGRHLSVLALDEQQPLCLLDKTLVADPDGWQSDFVKLIQQRRTGSSQLSQESTTRMPQTCYICTMRRKRRR